MLRLVLPDSKYIDSYVEALKEKYRIGIRPLMSDEEIEKIIADPFPHLDAQNRQGGYFTPEDGIERPKVPYNLYWLVDGDEFIGGISLRYSLNDFLEKHAGHAGYGIRPSKKKQGYATKMLGLALSIFKQQGVFQVMLTADEDNVASWKVIEANGGEHTGTIDSIFDDGKKTRQYWIKLEGMCG